MKQLISLAILSALLFFGGCANTGAQIVGTTAQILGSVVKRGDEIYSAQYRLQAKSVYESAAFKTAAREHGRDAALKLYDDQMRAWDNGVLVIRNARAGVFAIGTAAESIRSPHRVPKMVEAVAYSLGAVIGVVQTMDALKVQMPPESIAALNHSCTFVTALIAGLKQGAPAIPKPCDTLARTGLVGPIERPAGTPTP